jgi:acyl carrier protein
VLFDAHQAGASVILRAIREHRVSILFSFPALLRSVVQNAEESIGDHLRLVRIGGDTTLWSDIAMLRAWLASTSFVQLIYAATEAPMMQWFVTQAQFTREEKIPIGHALSGNALAIVDEDGAPTPEGEVGELIVRSRYVALGQWSNGACELADIQADRNEPSLRILKTGDLVRRRHDGLFDRIGRKDRQVKIRGARVELDGVEMAIRRHPHVRDAGVIARTDDDGSTRLIAYVERHEKAPSSLLSDLSEMMRRTMPAHTVPSRFYLTPRIPRLPTSKLDVQALQSMDKMKINAEGMPRAPSATFVLMDSNTLESTVALAWRKVLGVAAIDANADFFALGGDSLRAITLSVELEKSLGKAIPLTLINEAPGFRRLFASGRNQIRIRLSAALFDSRCRWERNGTVYARSQHDMVRACDWNSGARTRRAQHTTSQRRSHGSGILSGA